MPSTSDTDHQIPVFEPGSYRDASASVFYAGRRVFRGLDSEAAAVWSRLKTVPFFEQAMARGAIVETHELDQARLASLAADFPPQKSGKAPWERWPTVVEHARIPFVSYPYEWPFLMLRDAALLHLELLDQALAEGFTIKDGSAYNIQWRGCAPAFVDTTSFEPYQIGRPWQGYRQFCQMFLYPLMLRAYRNVAFQPWLRGSLDGIPPAEFRKLLSWRDCFRPGVFQHVILHAMLAEGRTESVQQTHRRLERTGIDAKLVRATVRHLKKTIDRMRAPRVSNWTDYAHKNSYSPEDAQTKRRFVSEAVRSIHPRRLWDLGCNTGEYSRIGAGVAEHVVALDSDAPCINVLYQDLKREGRKNILPLIWDAVNTSPNLGWRGRERKALVRRGRPDLCLCLAFIHHLALKSSVPLREIVGWLADLGAPVVVEFVDRHDPMAVALLGNRPDSCPDYNRAAFEAALAESFVILQSQQLSSGKRILYLARPSVAAHV